MVAVIAAVFFRSFVHFFPSTQRERGTVHVFADFIIGKQQNPSSERQRKIRTAKDNEHNGNNNKKVPH